MAGEELAKKGDIPRELYFVLVRLPPKSTLLRPLARYCCAREGGMDGGREPGEQGTPRHVPRVSWY
eukprot:1516075-Rhodomonas_salina.2